MTKFVIFTGISIALLSYVFFGVEFFVPAPVQDFIKVAFGTGSKYGIYEGMNSDDAQRKLYSQGFKDVVGKNELTGSTTKYFQKGRVSIRIQWSHKVAPNNPSGTIKTIAIDEGRS
ncbi:hypothetical protein [Chamaesiphon sp.]|uniref:hypothetical protein n=1 Tax=Chamaesiphon sp. TaxID=2814140 RepID=UPI003593ED99